MSEPFRRPVTLRADDPRIIQLPPDPPPVENAQAVADPAIPVAVVHLRRFRWGTVFWSALSALVLIGFGLAVIDLIESLFSRSPALGTVGLALAAIAGMALLAIAVREVAGLLRLARIEVLRERAASVVANDDREQGRALVRELLALTKPIPALAAARSRLAAHLSDIIDGRDLVGLAERGLMAPLDAEARRLVAAAGKRVSLVTAISPRAAVDMLFVLVNALRLIRQLAALYGGRPGALGLFRLFRQVISHLAVTGGVAVSDGLIQQVIGHGVAAKLSARLGEGVVNGLLTARLGLLAIELTRPLPFAELPRPTLNELAGSLLRISDSQAAE